MEDATPVASSDLVSEPEQLERHVPRASNNRVISLSKLRQVQQSGAPMAQTDPGTGKVSVWGHRTSSGDWVEFKGERNNLLS